MNAAPHEKQTALEGAIVGKREGERKRRVCKAARGEAGYALEKNNKAGRKNNKICKVYR